MIIKKKYEAFVDNNLKICDNKFYSIISKYEGSGRIVYSEMVCNYIFFNLLIRITNMS